MLTEGFLAVLVILACVAGLGLGIPEVVDGEETGSTLTGTAAYHARYATWQSAGGLAAKVGAFVDGSANFIQALSIPAKFAVALMGVFVASFAATTLDSACRLQRYVTQELASAVGIKPLTNKHAATIFAVTLAGIVASLPGGPGKPPGTGGLLLWPLFGATNQLLAGLAFLVILFWMWRRRIPVWFVAIPALFMLVLPAIAMLWQLFVGPNAWLTGDSPNFLLGTFGLATLALEAWILLEAAKAWPKAKGILEPPPVDTPTAPDGPAC